MTSAPEVLLVDDNPADLELTTEVLKRSKPGFRVSTVLDGAEALAFLRRRGRYTGKARPDLIVLDLELPRKHGREVLSELKHDPDRELARIPVVIFTTSQSASDINGSYELGANCYIQKPVDFEQFRETVKSAGFYWLVINQAPVAKADAQAAS
jgi:chemotaxis family two-component system response regulator Rcp1